MSHARTLWMTQMFIHTLLVLVEGSIFFNSRLTYFNKNQFVYINSFAFSLIFFFKFSFLQTVGPPQKRECGGDFLENLRNLTPPWIRVPNIPVLRLTRCFLKANPALRSDPGGIWSVDYTQGS